ncbi:Hypothetical predicted protein [Marmota monax]|uniref:DPY30 domain-containing protein 2 n=1 Tax=Marmota monax TaxID=9995 RepID=A0A5E4BYN9_MARMO|nr:hypothetical protein GHT09_003263 [Marmota monax]VTJ73782.1 Hypothetical predicted protein [Marmota monax]
METEYLKKCFGNSLSQALAEVAKVQPNDPIEFLARWLYHYRKIALANEKVHVCAGVCRAQLPWRDWDPRQGAGVGQGGLVHPPSQDDLGPSIPEVWRVCSWNPTQGCGVGGFGAASRLKLVTGRNSTGLKDPGPGLSPGRAGPLIRPPGADLT